MKKFLPYKKLFLEILYLGIALLSFCMVFECWLKGYIAEAFFARAVPFSIICFSALLGLAILEKDSSK